jgi:hypothetical protein
VKCPFGDLAGEARAEVRPDPSSDLPYLARVSVLAAEVLRTDIGRVGGLKLPEEPRPRGDLSPGQWVACQRIDDRVPDFVVRGDVSFGMHQAASAASSARSASFFHRIHSAIPLADPACLEFFDCWVGGIAKLSHHAVFWAPPGDEDMPIGIFPDDKQGSNLPLANEKVRRD